MINVLLARGNHVGCWSCGWKLCSLDLLVTLKLLWGCLVWRRDLLEQVVIYSLVTQSIK